MEDSRPSQRCQPWLGKTVCDWGVGPPCGRYVTQLAIRSALWAVRYRGHCSTSLGQSTCYRFTLPSAHRAPSPAEYAAFMQLAIRPTQPLSRFTSPGAHWAPSPAECASFTLWAVRYRGHCSTSLGRVLLLRYSRLRGFKKNCKPRFMHGVSVPCSTS